MSERRRRTLSLCSAFSFVAAIVALLLVPSAAGALEADPAHACERVVVVPLEPSGLTPDAARAEEDRLRELISKNLSVCVQPREQAAQVLKSLEGHRLPVCEDAACRKELAAKFDADWLVSGTAYGFGGGRTVTLTLWSRDGLAMQRGSYASGSGVDEAEPQRAVIALFHDARTGRSIAAGSDQKGGPERVQRSHWPEIALGVAAVAALAGGVAFASASQSTADKISRQQTGCEGDGEQSVSCFQNTVHTGQNQATAANTLFGVGTLLGVGAGVLIVVDLP